MSARFDEKTREQVRSKIKAMFNTHTYGEIAKYLNEAGTKRAAGKDWDSVSIGNMVRSLGLVGGRKVRAKRVAAPVAPKSEAVFDSKTLFGQIAASNLPKAAKLRVFDALI